MVSQTHFKATDKTKEAENKRGGKEILKTVQYKGIKFDGRECGAAVVR